MPDALHNGRPRRATAVLALLITLGAVALAWPLVPHKAGDGNWYERLADGRADEVPRPFANRILGPWLAGRIADAADASVDTGFRVLGVVSLAVFAAGLSGLVLDATGRRAAVIAALCTPFAVLLFRDYYLPDLLHAALLAMIFRALALRPAWTAVLVLVAVLVRETTVVFVLVAAALALRDGRRALAASTLAAGVLGVVLAWWLSGGSAHDNVHGLAAPAYTLFKVPFNLLGNVLGLEVWVNTIHDGEPIVAWDLPGWMRLGEVARVGVSSWNPLRPLYGAAHVLALFGLAPSLLVWIRRRRAWTSDGAPLWLRSALVYGLIAALAAPVSGSALSRLLGYGWPALLLAAPILVVDAVPAASRSRLLILHLLCAWTTALGALVDHAALPGLVMLLAAGACHLAAWRMLHDPEPGRPGAESSIT